MAIKIDDTGKCYIATASWAGGGVVEISADQFNSGVASGYGYTEN